MFLSVEDVTNLGDYVLLPEYTGIFWYCLIIGICFPVGLIGVLVGASFFYSKRVSISLMMGGVVLVVVAAGVFMHGVKNVGWKTSDVWYERAEETFSYKISYDELKTHDVFNLVKDGYVGEIELTCELNDSDELIARTLKLDGRNANLSVVTVDACKGPDSRAKIIKLFEDLDEKEQRRLIKELRELK